MKKTELLKKIEELEAKIKVLETRPNVVLYQPIQTFPEPQYFPKWFTVTYTGNTCCEGTNY